MDRLEGKVAIVTGATSGIGKRIAQTFAEEGAKVALAGRREAEGHAAAEAIGEGARFVRTDVAREADVEALVAATLEAWGRIDCLVNNAGGPAPRGSIESLAIEGVDAAMAVLFNGVLLGMKHVAPVMRRQGSGSIINIASVAAHLAGFSTSTVYSAAKAAVVHFTRCVAMELGESGVRVNSISPGAIATGIFGKALGLPIAEAEKTAPKMREIFATVQPIKRSGMPEDIARCALYLASDEAGFVNGIDIVVDGGLIGGRHWTPQHQAMAAMGEAIDGPPAK